MTRWALAAAALLIATAAASPPTSPPSHRVAGCPKAEPGPFPGFSGQAGVMVAGERRPRCGLRLRTNHGARAFAAGPDGLLYIAEDSSGMDDARNERGVDTGAVDVFRADGKLVRRLIDGVVGPTALAVDDRNRLFVLNSGSWMDRGQAAGVRPTIAIFEPRATAPSRTILLLPREHPGQIALTPEGDAIVADTLEYGRPDGSDGPVTRYRASDGKRMWSVGVPHPSLRLPDEITAMSLNGLRVRGTISVVALYSSDKTTLEPFFVELSPVDGQLLRKVGVPKASGLAIDRGGRILVTTPSGVLAFATVAVHGVRTAAPAVDVNIATSRDGELWYRSDTSIRGFDAAGQLVASFSGVAETALIDGPRTSAPLSDETPRPSPAPSPTPKPPALADVTANVRGARGIAYDRLKVRGAMPPPAVDIDWSAALRLAPIGSRNAEAELVHVAILGPYARLANRDGSIVEIIDCIHRTVTSLSPRRKVARYDLPQRAVGQRDDSEPINAPAQVTIATRREGDTSIAGARVERYTLATSTTKVPGAANRTQVFPLSTERVAIAGLPGPPVVCTGPDVGPASLFPLYDWTFGNGFERQSAARFTRERAHVIRLGPKVPNRFEVAYVTWAAGFFDAVFSGNLRALSDRDAALFAVPQGTRLDRHAPTLVEPTGARYEK